MADYYNIAMIGSGNLAWHLGPEIENAGHRIAEIYSRKPENARKLQRRLYQAEIKNTLDFSGTHIDIAIVCVTDDAVEDIAKEIVLPEAAIIVHTSGSLPIARLGYAATARAGVFYPVQTFSKEKKVTFEDIPILVEAEDSFTRKVLLKLARSISRHVENVATSDRLAVHVAAVFACNFTNHFFSIAERILKSNGQQLALLRPLIAETINKSLDIGPERARTGPAARGDLETLDRHMTFLQGTEFQEMYRLISDQILNHSES